jgi:hypothetical protein
VIVRLRWLHERNGVRFRAFAPSSRNHARVDFCPTEARMVRAGFGWVIVGVSTIAACSGAKKTSGFSDGVPDDGLAAADAGEDVAFGGGSSGGPDFGDGAPQMPSPDAACASATSKATLQTLDMYVMLDQSGSMSDKAGGDTKWQQVTSALQAFVSQPQLAGVGVGIQYFGLGPGGLPSGGPSSCDAADYRVAEVEIAPLPGVAHAIIASMGAHSPATDTPTMPALQGAIDHATAWQQAHSDHVTVVVFATDGEPQSSCDDNLADIDGVAAAGASSAQKILTFVIGVGTSLSNLDGMAQAGGTGQAYLVDTGANAQQQFLDALNKIRGQALGCVYAIPLPEAGVAIDPGMVNVRYTPGDGSAPVTLPKVSGAGACPPSGDAWYYDDAAAPTKIVLCDTSCKRISGDATATVDIVTGCATVVR